MKKSIPLSLLLCLFAASYVAACGPDGFSGGVAKGGGFNRGFGGFGQFGGFNPNGFAMQQFGVQQQMVAAQMAARQNFVMQAAARRAKTKPMRIARVIQQREEMLARRAKVRAEMIAKKEARERAEQEFLASARTWTDSTGRYEVKAKLIAYEANAVKLKRADGEVVTVPLAKLSLSDVAWVSTELNLPNGSSPSLLAVR